MIPEKVWGSENCNILRDFPIQTDKQLKHNKPDILVKKRLVIGPLCPSDTRIKQKEYEKLTRLELARMWKVKKFTILPVVIGFLGIVTHTVKSWKEKIVL